jgi:hypothetical protein
VHGSARRLDLICPDLWGILRHIPRLLNIADAGRQPDAI